MIIEQIIMIGIVTNTIIQLIWFLVYLHYRYQDNKRNFLEMISFNTYNTAKNSFYNNRNKGNEAKYFKWKD